MKQTAADPRARATQSSKGLVKVSSDLQTVLERLEKTVIREEAEHPRPIQLPLWYEPERGAPNSFLRSALFAAIQSKDRRFLKGVQLAASKDVSIKFTGEQLNQEDLSVWETLVHLAREHPLGNVCHFSAHGLLKKLGLTTGGKEHQRLHETITRMIGCVVEIKHEGKIYMGSLIEEGAAAESGTRGAPQCRYVLKLNRNLINLFGDRQWTAILWEQRLQLRRQPLAQALHGYYSSHRDPFPVKVETLQQFVGSANEQKAGFKRQLKKALDELVTIGFLTGYRIERDLVAVVRV